MRRALVVGVSVATAAAAAAIGINLRKKRGGSQAQDKVAAVLKSNIHLFTKQELTLIGGLVDVGQAHLFAAWPEAGTQDANKRRLVAQLVKLDGSYHGGLLTYINNARRLLRAAKEGVNPFEGYVPSVPHGERLDFASPEFLDAEKDGLVEAGRTAFVLVAGGLGERLGYSGIKVALPVETATGMSFLELYCRFIGALQVASGTSLQLPFAIMTSDDTHARTAALLEAHNHFGLTPEQVTLMKQEKVACLVDNDATLALDPSDTYALQTKPHGHGDVHALLHATGLAQRWRSQGFKWVAFFQDTNALVCRGLVAALGVSARHGYDMNSLAVPRRAKEAIGAITTLRTSSGATLTTNVEYNQLDPLLRATPGWEAGDVDDSSGNINQLVLALDSYVATLQQTGGVISEFVNPKYKDASKTAFKSSTRLECMMQDFPKALPADARVGFTTIQQVWASYSPVKNNPTDAAAKAQQGEPTHSATTAELDVYRVHGHVLATLAGARIAPAQPKSFNGIPCSLPPPVVLSPEWAPTVAAAAQKVAPGSITLQQGAVVVLDGPDITIQGPLKVAGALVIRAVRGARVRVAALEVSNDGWAWQPLAPGEDEDAPEELRIRGFRVVKHDTAEFNFDQPGEYTVGVEKEKEEGPTAPRATPEPPSPAPHTTGPDGATAVDVPQAAAAALVSALQSDGASDARKQDAGPAGPGADGEAAAVESAPTASPPVGDPTPAAVVATADNVVAAGGEAGEEQEDAQGLAGNGGQEAGTLAAPAQAPAPAQAQGPAPAAAAPTAAATTATRSPGSGSRKSNKKKRKGGRK